MFAEFFIKRPIFASVCAIVIVLGGAVSIPTLPIAQYPELAAPQVQVQSVYVGASAQAVESAVTTPLEQQINGAEGMRYMTSTSGSDGTSSITATFDVGRDKDMAAVEVQNRVYTAWAAPRRGEDTGVRVFKNSPAIVLAAGFYSDDNSLRTSSSATTSIVYVRDALKRVPGVGRRTIFGERKYAMRLWLDPVRLAARGLTAADVVPRCASRTSRSPRGRSASPPAPAGQTFQISVTRAGRLSDAHEFERIMFKRATTAGGAAARRRQARSWGPRTTPATCASTAATPSASACFSCPAPMRGSGGRSARS